MLFAACSEFPNDNHSLHRGAVWCCAETSGAASCELPVIAEEPDDGGPGGIDSAEQLAPRIDAARINRSLDEPTREVHTGDRVDDPFTTFIRLLEEVACTLAPRAPIASDLRALLGETGLETAALSLGAVEALIAGKYLEETSFGIQRTERFTRTVFAWRGILRGEDADLASCGSATLDEWAADLVARLLGNPVQATALRRELRLRGVAAFGLVAQAA